MTTSALPQALREIGGDVFLRSTREALASKGAEERALFTVALSKENLRFLESRLEALKAYRRDLFGDTVEASVGEVIGLLIDQYREEVRE